MGDILIHYNRESLLDVSTFDSAHRDSILKCRLELKSRLQKIEPLKKGRDCIADIGIGLYFVPGFICGDVYMEAERDDCDDVSIGAVASIYRHRWSYICAAIGSDHYEVYTNGDVAECFFNTEKLATISPTSQKITYTNPHGYILKTLKGKQWKVDTGEIWCENRIHVLIDGDKYVIPYRHPHEATLKEVLMIILRFFTLYPLWSKKGLRYEKLLPQEAGKLSVEEQHILIMAALYVRIIIFHLDF